MAIQWGYRPTGLQTTKSGITVPYRLVGESDHATARAYALAASPMILGAWYRSDVRLQSQGGGVWDVDAEYGPYDKKEPSANSYKWTFDTSGKTKHVTQGIEHIASYVPSGETAIDHKGAIGVTDDSVNGVDVPDRAYKWTEVWQLPAGSYGFVYSTILGELTGRTNYSYFRGFPAYTVQFSGGSGGGLSSDGTLREFSYSFEVSPSESGLTVGDITGISKVGWDYMSVRYEIGDDTSANKTTPKPIQADVDRVLYAFNFTMLGIGSGILS